MVLMTVMMMLTLRSDRLGFKHVSSLLLTCGLQTSSTHITWELVGNTDSQAQP